MRAQLRDWLRMGARLSAHSSVRRGGLALADQLVASAANFLTGIIVGRTCAQEEFGLYMLGFSIVQLAGQIQGPLIQTPYMVFSPRMTDEQRARYLGSTLIHQIGISAICSLSLLLGGLALSRGIGPEGLASVVWALALTITFILLREYARSVCFSELRFATALILDSMVAVSQIAALLALAYLGVLDAGFVFWIIGLACFLAVLAWLYRARVSIKVRIHRVVDDLRRDWVFGKWIFASSVLYDISIYTYPWILTFFHGVDSAGVWAACFGAVAITNPLIIGMVNHAGPEIVHSLAAGGVPALRRVVERINLVFIVLLAPLTITLLLLGNWLVVLFYSQKYDGHGLVVSLLALDIWLSPPRITLSRALFAMERANLDFATNFVSLIVLLACGVWLVRAFGPSGAAGAVLLGNSSAALAKLIAYLHLTGRGAEHR